MKTFRIYVTDKSQALSVLEASEFEAKDGATYVEVSIQPEQKMDVITLLNRQKVVLYDIEEV